MKKWTGAGALVAGVGVALTSLCCLPFAAALGLGLAAAGSVLTPYQPYLALASVAFVAVAFVQTLREPRCEDGSACDASSSRRWIIFGGVTLITVLLVTMPYWSVFLAWESS